MKTNGRLFFGALLLSTFVFAGSARAALYMMNFSVAGFQGGPGAVPTDPVTGSFVYEAAGMYAPIQSFISVNLVLAGHSYSPAEVSYFRDVNANKDMIGGALGEAWCMMGGSDDFWLCYTPNPLLPFDFMYSYNGGGSYWAGVYDDPNCFTTFTVTPVPEPAVPTLFALAAAMLLLRRSTPARA